MIRRPLVLTTRPAAFAGRSGYPLLADYLSEADVVVTARRDPPGWVCQWLARAARRLAFSRWYLGGSAALEWRGFQLLRRGQPRVVHQFWADFDVGFLDLYTRLAGHRLVGTFHHCADTIAGVVRFPNRLRNFDAVILMSESQRPFMAAAGVPDERIHVVHHGVDTTYFSPAAAPPTPGPFRVLSVGSYRRNFPALRAVCDRLAGRSEVEVRIVGPAATAQEFAGVSGVRYLSGLTDADLLAEYRAAGCFLLSVENATANNALLEGMACGLPVVGTRVGGVPEYVPAEAGYLVPASRPGEVADAVLELAADVAKRATMAAAARRRAEELAWPLVADRTRAVYATVGLTGRRR